MKQMNSDGRALRLENVVKKYKSGEAELEVLKDVSFEIAAGSTVSIIGPSGSGKTTLLGICAGLDVPTSGYVELNNEDIHEMSEDERSKLRNEAVGFVFQDFQLLPTLSALENVMIPLELLGKRNVRKQAEEFLRKVGLENRLNHYPVQLSGGEQQRVALARAFVNSPRILFADEPTGNLDSETGESVMELLFELNRHEGTTVVIVTHNLELAARTDRIMRIRNGELETDES